MSTEQPKPASRRPNVAVFVTARLKSTRLPGKVLLEISGRTLLEHLLERLRLATEVDQIVLCTSTHPSDDRLLEVARRSRVPCFRGSEEDVLQRYLEAAHSFGVDFAVITWGDEVFCDPSYIDRMVTTCFRRSPPPDLVLSDALPEGVYTYGVRTAALEEVVRSKSSAHTEVWRKYFENNSRFRIEHLAIEPRHQRRDLRLTCDYPEDFRLLGSIFEALYRGRNDFTLDQIIELLDSRPDLREINAFRQKDYEARIAAQSVCE